MSAGPATESRNICIECQSHDRQCGIQGVVASDPHQSCLASSLGAKAPNAKRPPARIYKRRRNSTDADEAVGQSSHPDEDQEHPRVKIQVNRIDSVVKRLARERESESSPGSRTAATQPFKSSYPRKGFVGTHKQNDGDSHHSGGFSHEATEEARTTTASVLAPDHDTHNASPLIAQLFNNEMVSTNPHCFCDGGEERKRLRKNPMLTHYSSAHPGFAVACRSCAKGPDFDIFKPQFQFRIHVGRRKITLNDLTRAIFTQRPGNFDDLVDCMARPIFRFARGLLQSQDLKYLVRFSDKRWNTGVMASSGDKTHFAS